MKKRFYYLSLIVALIATTLMSCQKNEGNIDLDNGPTGPDSYGFGYCSNNIESTIGIAGGAEWLLGAAVEMDKADLEKHGDMIVGIRCGIAGSGKNFTVYVCDNLDQDESEAHFVKNIEIGRAHV